jgi:hypothetical protein
VTKFFDCGPATFSDQAVEVHAYEAASPFNPDDHILGVDFVRRRSTNVITQPIPAFIGLAALLADLAH